MSKVTITIEANGQVDTYTIGESDDKPKKVPTPSNGPVSAPSDIWALIGLIGKLTYEIAQRKGPSRG